MTPVVFAATLPNQFYSNTAIGARLPNGVVSAARQVGSVIVCSFVR